jgi:hypothetical protein
VNMAMKLFVPQKAGNFLTCLVAVSFSRKTLLHEIKVNVSLVLE